MISKYKLPVVVIFIPPFICLKYFSQVHTLDPAQFYMKTDKIPALVKFTSVRETDDWVINRKVTNYAQGNKSREVVLRRVRVCMWRVWSTRTPGSGNSTCKGSGARRRALGAGTQWAVAPTALQPPGGGVTSVNRGKTVFNGISTLHFTLTEWALIGGLLSLQCGEWVWRVMKAIMDDERARRKMERSVRRLVQKAQARGACGNDGGAIETGVLIHCYKDDINISVSNGPDNNSDNYAEFVRF